MMTKDQNNLKMKFLVMLALVSLPLILNGMKFVHPGGFSTIEDLRFIKEKVNANKQPWKKAYDDVVNSKYGKLNYQHKAFKEVICGNHNNPNIGCENMVYDGMAAYAHALQWFINGKQAHADKAIKILDDWSRTWQRNKDFNDNLVASWATPWYVNAAEIIRYTGAGWSSKGINNFKSMCRKLLPYTTKGGMINNGKMTQIEAQISIAMFLDDEKEFKKALGNWRQRISTYIYQKSDGPRPKVPPGRKESFWGKDILVNGLCMETSRDYGHSLLGYNSIVGAAQIAWTQGVDLFKEEKNRIADYMELHGAWTTGMKKVPKNLLGGKVKCTGSKKSKLMPCGARAWDIAYRHLHDRLGMKLPATEKMIEKGRPASFQRWNYKPETLIAAGIPFNHKDNGTIVSGVMVQPESITLNVGESKTLTAIVTPSKAKNKKVSWSTDNAKVAKVNNKGKIEALATGIAFITVKTDDGGYTAKCKVTVTEEEKPNKDYPKIEAVDAEQAPNIASNLLDGFIDDDHRWSAEGYPKSVVIDYGKQKTIVGTNVYTYQGRSYHYTVSVSNKADKDFVEVVNQTGNTEGQPISHSFAAVKGRYVKLTVTGATKYANSWISINEFQIIEGAATPQSYTKYPTDDVYTENGEVINTKELRVENDKRRRISYMKFDVSDVDGAFSEATLKLKETSKEAGNGTFVVYLGTNENWNEGNVRSLPKKVKEVGSYKGNISKNQEFTIKLEGLELEENLTLIVDMETKGNDISFISSEGSVKPTLELSTLKGKVLKSKISTEAGSITIFPNPVKNILYVELDDENIVCPAYIQIFNMSGKIVKQQAISEDRIKLDITKLPQGMYIIEVKNGAQNYTSKFIKR